MDIWEREYQDLITVVIPTSPIPCNPSTEILDETYESIRFHLPDVPVLVLMDGVCPNDKDLADKYNGFKKRIVVKDWDNFNYFEFTKWTHQSGMLRYIFERDVIKTPLVLWIEHDLPLLPLTIDWRGIVRSLLMGEVAGIRFHLIGLIKQVDRSWVTDNGVPLKMTVGFTGHPQILKTEFLKAIVDSIEPDAKTYLEIYPTDFFLQKHAEEYPYGVYVPEGDHIRCAHIDGRTRYARPDAHRAMWAEFKGEIKKIK